MISNLTLRHGLLYASDKGGDGGQAGSGTNEAPKPPAVPRVDAARLDLVGFVRISLTDYKTMQAAGEAVTAAVAVLAKAGFVITQNETKFTREPETTFKVEPAKK